MCKGLRKYALAIKNNKTLLALLVIVTLAVCFQAVPAFANFAQEVVVVAAPNYGNSPPTVRTLPATDIYMDGSGTHATLVGSLDNLSTPPTSDVWFEWGYDTSYGNTVGIETSVAKTGTHTFDLTGFNPAETVHYSFAIHYRFIGENTDGITYGNDQSFYLNDAVSNGYRIIALAPTVFVGIGIVMLAGLLLKSITAALVLGGAVYIYLLTGVLEGMQATIRALWGG